MFSFHEKPTKYVRSILPVLIISIFIPALFSSCLRVDSKTSLQQRLQTARDQIYPASVNITLVKEHYSDGRSRRSTGGGSGIIVSKEGHVLTNYHVASDAIRITCTLPDGEQLPADIVGHDPLTDLSVLQMRLDQREADTPLPKASFGDSDALQAGDYVLAMGNPLSLSFSTTLGVVSNPKRVFTDFRGNDIRIQKLRAGEVTGLFTQWIQHDALILPGNSGGPLVNLEGDVIGINELGGNGVGFAIPSNLCKQVFNRFRDNGKITRGWAGFKILPVTRIDRKTGALVSSVRPASPAARGGLKPGDIILELDNEEVTVRFFEQVPSFYRRISTKKPGHSLRVTLLRDGEKKTIHLELMAMQDFLGDQVEIPRFGFTAREITEPMAIFRKYPDQRGVEVTGVRPGKPAGQATPPLESGDLIRSIGDKEINDIKNLRTFLKNLESFEHLKVSFRRNGEQMLTVMKSDQDDGRHVGGQLSKPWLGIETQVLIPSVAEALGIEETKGFRITRVYDDTNASEAGFQPGDILLEMNGKPLEADRTRDARRLKRRVKRQSIGDKVTFLVLRDGKKTEINVVLGESPESASTPERMQEEYFEFEARSITFEDRMQQKLDDKLEGVIVTNVKKGGWADLGGLAWGDIIRRIQGSPVSTIEEAEKLLTSAKMNQPERVQIFVQRGVRTQFVFLTPEWEASPRNFNKEKNENRK